MKFGVELADENRRFARIAMRCNGKHWLIFSVCLILIIVFCLIGRRYNDQTLETENIITNKNFSNNPSFNFIFKNYTKIIAKTTPSSALFSPRPISRIAIPPNLNQIKQLNLIRIMALEAINQLIDLLESNETISSESVDSLLPPLSTLWIMGAHEEFRSIADWIFDSNQRNFKFCRIFNHKNEDNFEEINSMNECVGSLLACYALSGDDRFLRHANQASNHLIAKLYNNQNNNQKENSQNKTTKIEKSKSKTAAEEVIDPLLELSYLADLRGDSQLRAAVNSRRDILLSAASASRFNRDHASWLVFPQSSDHLRNDLMANFYLRTLLFPHIQSHNQGLQLQAYRRAIDREIMFNRTSAVDPNVALYFVHDFYLNWGEEKTNYQNLSEKFEPKITVEACRLATMFAIGAHANEIELSKIPSAASAEIDNVIRRIEREYGIVRQIVKSCRIAVDRGLTEFLPHYQKPLTSESTVLTDTYRLGPNLAEIYFLMHRFTRENEYRGYAWKMAQSIYRYCRGYSSKDGLVTYHAVDLEKAGNQVKSQNETRINTGRILSRFVGSTLKYLYLTLADRSVLPLDRWILTEAGQPLPICGANDVAYPSEICAR